MKQYRENWPRCFCGDYTLPGHVTCGRGVCKEKEQSLEPGRDLPAYDEVAVDDIFRRNEGSTRNISEEESMGRKRSKKQGRGGRKPFNSSFLDHFSKTGDPKKDAAAAAAVPPPPPKPPEAPVIPPGARIATVPDPEPPLAPPAPGAPKNPRTRGANQYPLTHWSTSQDTYLRKLYQEGLPYAEIVEVLNKKFPRTKRTHRAIRERLSRIRANGQLDEKARNQVIKQQKSKNNSTEIVSPKALLFMERLDQGYYTRMKSAKQALSRLSLSATEREQLLALAHAHFKTTEVPVERKPNPAPQPDSEPLSEYYEKLTKPPVVPPDISFSTSLALLISKQLTGTVADFLTSAQASGYDIPTLVATLKKVT